MITRNGFRINDVRILYHHFHRILRVSFFNHEKRIGEEMNIGDFLTTKGFDMCFRILRRILYDAGFEKHSAHAVDSRVDNFFTYRLPPDFHGHSLRRKGLPIKLIDITARHASRTITIEYYTQDPECPDPDFLMEIDKEEFTEIPTLIDFEFLTHAIRHFFLLHQQYTETVHECRYDKVIPDHFIIQYQKTKIR